MHHHNHYYGHSHILARYCGLNDVHPPAVRGYIQHGWNVGCGWNPNHEFFDGAWRYTWSELPMQRGYTLGRRNYLPIGAPWLYLLEMEPTLGVIPEEEREGTLFFLFHGWEGGQVLGDFHRLTEEIKDTEPGPVTMSLYFTEYERPEIRELYQEAGFDVVCFGRRGWDYLGIDRQFLYKQLVALRRHRRVASNRLATAMFYGASVGCQIGVYGDPMTMEGENTSFGGQERLERLWPELLGKETDDDAVRETVEKELGRRWLLSPEELKATLFAMEDDHR